jgi:hypothetical protein
MGKAKLYVLSTKTFGMTKWLAEDGVLVAVPQLAEKMSKERADRIARTPACSPIIDWVVEVALDTSPPQSSVKVAGFLRKLWCLVAHGTHRTVHYDTAPPFEHEWATCTKCTKCGTWTTWF